MMSLGHYFVLNFHLQTEIFLFISSFLPSFLFAPGNHPQNQPDPLQLFSSPSLHFSLFPSSSSLLSIFLPFFTPFFFFPLVSSSSSSLSTLFPFFPLPPASSSSFSSCSSSISSSSLSLLSTFFFPLPPLFFPFLPSSSSSSPFLPFFFPSFAA